MTLWTPSGEYPVGRENKDQATSAEQPPGSTDTRPPGGATTQPGDPEAPSLEDLSPEQRAQVEEMARQVEAAQQRMLELPAESVVGQQALQFYELAALYLSQDPPRVNDARMAIDALKAVVERLGDRLGEAEAPLRQATTQLQLAFVEASKNTNS
jgi:hypothetical protein